MHAITLIMAEGLGLVASDHDLAAEMVVSAEPKGGWRRRVVSEPLYLA